MRAVTLDEAATLCRGFGHAWVPITAKKRTTASQWQISIQCDRCTTKRHDIIDRAGDLQKRSYEYPQGYKRSRIPRPELRMELKTVLRVWGSETEMELW